MGKPKGKMPQVSESVEQRIVIEWAGLMEHKYPELKLLYHIPNGGKRSATEAIRFKLEGVKAGVPDLCLPVARGPFHGLYIEMKAQGGKPTENQCVWLHQLQLQGYQAILCIGADAAIDTIKRYLDS